MYELAEHARRSTLSKVNRKAVGMPRLSYGDHEDCMTAGAHVIDLVTAYVSLLVHVIYSGLE